MPDQRTEIEARNRYEIVAAENFRLRELILDISTAMIAGQDPRPEIERALKAVSGRPGL